MKSEPFVKSLLDKYFPRTYLESVPIFRPDKAILAFSMANEIDFVLHTQKGRTHTLTIIECKDCKIVGDKEENLDAKKEWFAVYKPKFKGEKTELKGIKQQIRAQFIALLHNLDPLDEKDVLVRHGIVASSFLPRDTELILEGDKGQPSYFLMGLATFELWLKTLLLNETTPFLINQSEILRRLRCAKGVPTLGHPEQRNAISYSARCRRFIDTELFSHFKPTSSHWAINGSAGMGKSVLLAYAMHVFITDMSIKDRRNDTSFRDLNSFREKANQIGLPPIDQRQIWLVAQSEKQRDSLKEMHQSFCNEYSRINKFAHFQRVSPRIRLWSEIDSLESCNVLLVDEAHDLSLGAQEIINQWHKAGSNRYLVVATDRHQKLTLISPSATIIEGMDFTGHAVKLTRNYRNSFPVYIASFGILFRWFAQSGPKVIPKKYEFESEMGFKEVLPGKNEITLNSRNDSHPANIWENLISVIPSSKVAFSQLYEEGLSKNDVLWVRFSEESDDFDYEKLSKFTYFNLHSVDANALIDKYIKGQEFPIVVIEGLPAAFNSSEEDEGRDMWIARRQVYMVASRANVFLNFVESAGASSASQKELREIANELSGFDEQDSPSGRMWSLKIPLGDQVKELSMNQYLKFIEGDEFKVTDDEEIKEGKSNLQASGDKDEPGTNETASSINTPTSKDSESDKNQDPISHGNQKSKISQSDVYKSLRFLGLESLKPKNRRQEAIAAQILLYRDISIDENAGEFCYQLHRAVKNLYTINEDISQNDGVISPGLIKTLSLDERKVSNAKIKFTQNLINLFIKQNNDHLLKLINDNLSGKSKLPKSKNDTTNRRSHLLNAEVYSPITISSLSRALSKPREQIRMKVDKMNIHGSIIPRDNAKAIAKEYGFDLRVIIRGTNKVLSNLGLTVDAVRRMTKQ